MSLNISQELPDKWGQSTLNADIVCSTIRRKCYLFSISVQF